MFLFRQWISSQATHRYIFRQVLLMLACAPILMLSGCAGVDTPKGRSSSFPSPAMADQKPEAVNDKPDSVLYLPLGSDVLVPEALEASPLPSERVGPFELRSETLAGALQLILADYNVPLAFETDEGLTRTITVANLSGPLNSVVDRVCGLADLYCAFEDGLLIVKETQTFAVTVPPVGGEEDILDALATGLQAITGATPITESGTRTIIYEATNRTSKLAERYFQRIRAHTALITFEIYIWEVALDTVNDMGINWSHIAHWGEFSAGIKLPGAVGEGTAYSIGLPTKDSVNFDSGDILKFISQYGSVKTISQPQITMLSGSQATLRAASTTPYVSSLSRTVEGDDITVSTETDSVDSGFTITITSNWDNATVYGTIEIELQEFLQFEVFSTEGTELKLPETTERELSTQIRIRPGDSLLIAGLVQERDQFDKNGPGFTEPLFPTSRRVAAGNSELVFLLKPRVIVFTDEEANRVAREVIEAAANPEDVPMKRAESGGEMNSIPSDILNPSR